MSKQSYIILAVALILMVGAVGIVPLAECGISAAFASEGKQTFTLVLKDSATKEPISGVEMSLWYFNREKRNEATNNNSYKLAESVSDENGRISFEGIEKLDPSITQIIISRDNDSEYPRLAIDPNIALFKKKLALGRQYDRDLSVDRSKIKSERTYTIYMEPAVEIRGKVIDPDGNLVAGATVDAIPGKSEGKGGNSLTGDGRYRVMTNNLGQYSIGLPNEDMDVRLIAHDGDMNEWRTWANGRSDVISLTENADIKNVTISLTHPCTINGIVKDKNGKPVANAGVSIKYPDGQYSRNYIPETNSDENGRFTLTHVRAGDLFILCDRNYVTTYHPEKCEWPEGYLVPASITEGQSISNVEVLGLTSEEVSIVERNNSEKMRNGLGFDDIGFIKLR